MGLLKWLAIRIAVIAGIVWLVNNVDQALSIVVAAVMFVVGLFDKAADAIAELISSADSATAIHLLTQLAHAVLGG